MRFKLTNRMVAYICATVIVIAAFISGYDGTLAAMVICGMLGVDYYAQRRQRKNG